MKGFVLGILVAVLAFAAVLWWTNMTGVLRAGGAPSAVDAGPQVRGKAPERERKKRRRGAVRVALAPASQTQAEPEPEPEPEPVRLSAADLKIVAQGDDLSRPDIIRMDLSDDSGTRELSQDEIDTRWRAREEAVLTCISRARPDEDTYVPGRVVVKFRIQRAGTVRGVRVEAPAVLQRGGLYACIKGVVGGLRFAPSNGSQVVSYPFTLS